VPLIGNWFANTAHVFLFNFAFKFAKLGGINQGVIAISVVFASVFNSIVFYCAFGEKIGCGHFIGMFLIVTCGILLSIAASSKKASVTLTGETSESAYGFYALACAMMVPVNFSFKHFLIRKFKGTYNSFDLSFDSNVAENLTFVIMTFIFLDRMEGENEVQNWIVGSIAGFVYSVARIGIAMAVSEGYGGPA
jgi:hypothetical protein